MTGSEVALQQAVALVGPVSAGIDADLPSFQVSIHSAELVIGAVKRKDDSKRTHITVGRTEKQETELQLD
jgi:hypothetical protein